MNLRSDLKGTDQLSDNPYTLPVKFLLNGGRELLIELLQIHKAHSQCVPLRPDQLFSITQVFDLPIAVLESESKPGKRVTVIHQIATTYFWIQERRITCARKQRHPHSLTDISSNNIVSQATSHRTRGKSLTLQQGV